MAKKLLVDFLKRNEDMSKVCIIYKPDGGSITLKKEETGYDKDQNVSVETDRPYYYFKWYPIIINKKLYLIGSYEFSDSITLKGKIGYDNGIRCLQRYGNLFSNQELNAKGSALTREEYNSLPRYIQQNFRGIAEYKHWLATKLKGKGGFFGKFMTFYTIQHVSHPWHGGELVPNESCGLYYSDGTEIHGTFPIRPIIYLPDNILVDDDSVDNVMIDTHYNHGLYACPNQKALKLFIN